ncbi:DUF7453 family protein [Prosthecobacter debontii]|nr:choice-of-anchor D domain-containing protein [Prosthecobacter debontii]
MKSTIHLPALEFLSHLTTREVYRNTRCLPRLLRWLVTGLMVLGGFLTASAQSSFTTVATDSFNYSAGTLNGASGGSGWTNNWTWSYGSGSSLVVNTSGFGYTGLSTSGGRAAWTSGGNNISQCTRQVPLMNSGVVYVRFLAQLETGSGGGTPQFRLRKSGSPTGAFGGNGGTYAAKMSILNSGLVTLSDGTASSSANLSALNLVVARIDYSAAKTEMWVNPNLSTFDYESPPTADATYAGLAPEFDTIEMITRSAGSFDEVTILQNPYALPISENFDSGTLPTTLEQSGTTMSFSGGAVVFDGIEENERTYVRTKAGVGNLVAESFVAEVTMIHTGESIVFFGMGSGDPNPSGSYEPTAPSLHIRAHGGGLDGDSTGVVDDGLTNVANLGNGTHRLRLIWNANTQMAVFQLDEDYAGGAFQADVTTGAFDGSDNGFSDPETRIFFGGNGVSFDDLEISVLTGPEIAVSGNGTDIVDGDSSPTENDHTDFGQADVVAGSVVRTFTLENTGPDGLTVGTVSVGGTNAGDFTITTQPGSSVVSGNSTTFQVTFNPSAAGLRTATLSFSNDDGDENPFNFSIQGSGTTAPTVVTGGASAVTAYSVTLSGTVNPNGLATTVQVQYSRDPAMASGVTTTAVQNLTAGFSGQAISADLSGLLSDASYYYRVIASNTAGDEAGDIQTFQTNAPVASDEAFGAASGVAGGGQLYRPMPGLINNDGRILFEAAGQIGIGDVTAANDEWLMTDTSGSMKVIAREGTLVASGQSLRATFPQTLLTDGGRSLALDSILGASTTNDYLYVSSPEDSSTTEILSREGDAAPVSGVFLTHTGKPLADHQERVYFSCGLSGVASTKNSGIWYDSGSGLTKLVQEGENVSVAVGAPAWLGQISNVLAAGGDGCAFVAILQNNPDIRTQKTDSKCNQALFSAKPGEISMIVRKGDAVPGVSGGVLNSLNGVSRCSSEDHAYLGLMKTGTSITTANDQVMVAVIDGVSSLVAREGVTEITGGLTLKSFGGFYITTSGAVVFQGVLGGATTTTDGVLCRWTQPGGIELMAREGDLAAGTGGLNVGTIQALSVSDAGAVVLQCILSNGKVALLRDIGSGLTQLVRAGPGQTVVFGGLPRTILTLSIYNKFVGPGGGGGGMGAAINDSGEVLTVLSLGSRDYVAKVYR